MRFFFDTEFLETSKDGISRLELISIGIVSETGRELYLENSEFVWERPDMDKWMVENVKPLLAGPGYTSWQTPAQMAESIKEFVGDETPEWWAYVSASDWACLLSLYGRLIDRPKTWPSVCHDLKIFMQSKGLSKSNLPVQDQDCAHNALDDARWNRLAWLHLDEITDAYVDFATDH